MFIIADCRADRRSQFLLVIISH